MNTVTLPAVPPLRTRARITGVFPPSPSCASKDDDSKLIKPFSTPVALTGPKRIQINTIAGKEEKIKLNNTDCTKLGCDQKPYIVLQLTIQLTCPAHPGTSVVNKSTDK